MQVVGIDTETHLFKPGTKAPPVVVMSLDRGDGYGSLHLREEAEGIFRQLVADDEVMLVAHNASYDMTVLANQYNDLELLSAIFDAYERGRIRCSKIRSMLIAIAFDWMDYDPKLKAPPKFSLAKMVERHLGEEIEGKHGPDIWRMRYAELDGVPLEQWPQEAKDYARLDAVYHRRLFEMLERTYGKPADIDEVLQCKTDFVFYLMSCWGMLTDPEEVEALSQALEKEVAEAEKKLVALGLMREPKGTVRKDLFCDRVALLYEKRNLPLPMTPGGKVSLTAKVLKVVADDPIVAAYIESKGKPSADLEAYGLVEWASATKNTALIQQRVKDWYEAHDLPVPMTEPDNENTKPSIRTNEETLSDTDDEGLNLLADSSAARKELTSFVPVIRTREPIHAGWNILVKSGRSSCRGPNLQQLPRREGVRECFVARPGYVYVAADYHVAELCSLAQVCINIPEIGYSRLGDAINAGMDPHLNTAADLLSISYEEAVAQYAEGSPAVKDARQLAKCFHPDTEVLTRRGWVRIADVTMEDEVAQADAEPGGVTGAEKEKPPPVTLSWTRPTRLTYRPHNGEMLHLQAEGIDLKVTPDHPMWAFRSNGKEYRTEARYLDKARYWANAGTMPGGEWSPDEDLLRMAVCAQADGYIDPYGRIQFGFKRSRKIIRFEKMITRLGFDARCSESGGVVYYHLSKALSDRVLELLDGKAFDYRWLDLTAGLRKVALEELEFWDSNRVSKRIRYCNTSKQSVDVMQALATLDGRKSASWWTPRENEKHADFSILSICDDRQISRGGNLKTTPFHYEGNVYCLTVPTGRVVVRNGEGRAQIPVITYQCANFGLPGGLGASSFVAYAKANSDPKKPIILSVQEAADLKRHWLTIYPEVKAYFDWHNNLLMMGGGTIAVTQMGSGRVRGGVGYCDGLNTRFQGLTADGAKESLFRISRECYTKTDSPLFGSRPVAFIHDEILMESPEEMAADAAERLSQLMVEGMSVYVPDVKVSADAHIMRRWYKGAKPVRDANGRLIPWEPKEKAA